MGVTVKEREKIWAGTGHYGKERPKNGLDFFLIT
jgi:hypothetical protein